MPDSMLKHNIDHGGMLYKYDLPIENQPIIFQSMLVPIADEPNTPVENLFEVLDCDKDTAYESFIIKLN